MHQDILPGELSVAALVLQGRESSVVSGMCKVSYVNDASH